MTPAADAAKLGVNTLVGQSDGDHHCEFMVRHGSSVRSVSNSWGGLFPDPAPLPDNLTSQAKRVASFAQRVLFG